MIGNVREKEINLERERKRRRSARIMRFLLTLELRQMGSCTIRHENAPVEVERL